MYRVVLQLHRTLEPDQVCIVLFVPLLKFSLIAGTLMLAPSLNLSMDPKRNMKPGRQKKEGHSVPNREPTYRDK